MVPYIQYAMVGVRSLRDVKKKLSEVGGAHSSPDKPQHHRTAATFLIEKIKSYQSSWLQLFTTNTTYYPLHRPANAGSKISNSSIMFSSAARTAASRLSGHIAARSAVSASARAAPIQPSLMAARFASVSHLDHRIYLSCPA